MMYGTVKMYNMIYKGDIILIYYIITYIRRGNLSLRLAISGFNRCNNL